MKLSKTQLDVLARLASCDEPLSYFKGGFWAILGPGKADIEAGQYPSWSTTIGTVRALEKLGLLKQTGSAANYPINAFPALSDRVLSAKGLAVATGTSLPAQGLVEAVAAYTGHILHYRSYEILNDAQWRTLIEQEPSLNDGTAAFISNEGDIRIHAGYEADALHELVHAAGVKPDPQDNTFICEGIAQVATEAIAKELHLRVRRNYKDEVRVVLELLVPASRRSPRELVRIYIDHGLEGIASFINSNSSHQDFFGELLNELRHTTGRCPLVTKFIGPRIR